MGPLLVGAVLSVNSRRNPLHRALGAQLLQLKLSLECTPLYLTPLALNADAPVRGGVPILFPQFAGQGPLVKHGFARHVPWKLVGESAGLDSCSFAYQLDVKPNVFPLWPHSALLQLCVSASQSQFTMRFTVKNTDVTAFRFTGGLHPYWQVSNLLAAKVSGLRGNESLLQFTDQPIEQLFPMERPLLLECADAKLQLQASGFTEWMIWNPGRNGAKLLADLPDDDWQRFVCIEPVCVSQPAVLEPGQTFQGQLTASFVG